MSSQDRDVSGCDYLDLVRSALKQWHNFTFLGKHDLAHLASVQTIWQQTQYSNTLQGKGMALQHLLNEFIETLRPDSNAPDPHDKHWRAYIILIEHYVKQRTTDYIADLLGISRRTYFAEQHKALERLSGILQNHEHRIQIEQQNHTSSANHPPSTEPVSSNIVIPTPLTTFIGRDQEIAEIQARLLDPKVRLLTLIGAPGIGKTRLAIQVAKLVQNTFTDGVWFVPLAPIKDPALVASTVAHQLNIVIEPNRAIEELLQKALQQCYSLLILDNFEHLIAATPFVTQLLATTQHLTILVTSRSALRISAEHQLPLSPLDLPSLEHISLYDLQSSAAIELFISRAQSVCPEFALTDKNASAMHGLSTYLGGIPLAIELAASRSKLFTPQQLLSHLNNSTDPSALDFLNSGLTDMEQRHRTLRITFDWSYHLLDAHERQLFRRLSIFVGSWTLEAAVAVCSDEHTIQPTLNTLEMLLDKSLIYRQDEDIDCKVRFAMLEIIRVYSAEHFIISNDVDTIYQRYVDYYVSLAERDATTTDRLPTKLWLSCIAQNYPNLRAVLEWTIAHNHIDSAARLANALTPFWRIRGALCEGRQWLEYIRCTDTQLSPILQAYTLNNTGLIAVVQGEYSYAYSLFAESLSLFEQSQDVERQTKTLNYLGMVACRQGQWVKAEEFYTRYLPLVRRLEDTLGVARCFNNLGNIAKYQKQFNKARHLYQQSLNLFKSLNNERNIAGILNNLGELALEQGAFVQAQKYLQESLSLFHKIGENEGIQMVLRNLGYVALDQKNFSQAHTFICESLQLCYRTGDQNGFISSIEGLSWVALVQGNLQSAVTLLSFAHMQRHVCKIPLMGYEQVVYERVHAISQKTLKTETWQAAWEVGSTISPVHIMDQVLHIAPDTT